MRAPLRLTAAALLAACACSTPVSKEGYFKVVVTFDPTISATCFAVMVTDQAGTKKTSNVIARPTGRDTLEVAVFQDSLTQTVSVQAFGFTGAACSTPAEKSDPVEATFVASTVVEVDLSITATTGLTDGGLPDAGLTDGGLPDAGLTDGGQPDAGLTDGGQPDAGPTDGGVPDAGPACDPAAIDCANPNCNGQTCGVTGHCQALQCAGATSEVCNDGIDNDGDGLIDCLDPDCNQQPCSDSNACTVGEHCVNRVCTGATPKDCAAGLPACVMNVGCDAGVCLVAPLAVMTGTCDDGLACTTGDTCDGDGGCVGTPKTCAPSSNPCLAPTCAEPSGLCGYTVDLTANCTDNDGCTQNDACLADGGCAGTPMTCPAPTECQNAGSCQAGSCVYPPKTGQSCSGGGTCNLLGQCQPPSNTFPYVPSNFTGAQVTTGAAGDFNPDCAIDVNTSTTDGGVAITGPCLGPAASTTIITQPSGPDAVLWGINGSLNLAAAGTITAHGTRPLIIAVLGNATITGKIISTAGVDQGCASRSGMDGTAGTLGQGGGGAGAAFATKGTNGGKSTSNGTAGSAQAASGNQTLIPLRGGCSGGVGSSNVAGGLGGGAVQVSATGTVIVNGTISVNGGGGNGGGPPSLGGGGGGSGGAVLLEGTTVTVNSQGGLYANGGAGGEAGSLASGQAGASGANNTTAATGGAGMSNCGGDGGNGGVSATAPTAGKNAGGNFCFGAGGGGGGGGSVGRVRLNALNQCNRNGTISPANTGNGSGC
jgi:hypothetical protein